MEYVKWMILSCPVQVLEDGQEDTRRYCVLYSLFTCDSTAK